MDIEQDHDSLDTRIHDEGPTKLIRPKPKVTKEKKMRGPMRRTAMVAGSWKHTPATVKMRMETEKRLPWSKPRSLSMLVTEALEMRPLSRRLRLHNRPAMVHSLMSTFLLSLLSSLAVSAVFGLAVSETKADLDLLSDTSVTALMGDFMDMIGGTTCNETEERTQIGRVREDREGRRGEGSWEMIDGCLPHTLHTTEDPLRHPASWNLVQLHPYNRADSTLPLLETRTFRFIARSASVDIKGRSLHS